ncbi:hypothetical protein LOK74_04645 [Brevibacillus humidisoli]|nr:hypothetical protein [Brevibacillus humidisoli]UFJ41796.1 hypothetical protein LOK74_04645 [Brevibacillus humidisoli]
MAVAEKAQALDWARQPFSFVEATWGRTCQQHDQTREQIDYQDADV